MTRTADMMPGSPYLDEDSLMAVVDDVWSLLSPSSSPVHHVEPERIDATMTDTETGVAARTPVKKTKKKRRPDRNRPRHEIARLRTQAAELESELQKQAAKSSTNSTNLKLKTMLRESFDEIHALEQNLNTQMEELMRDLLNARVTVTRNLPYDVEQDDKILTMMARSLEDQYKSMDHVLHLAGLDPITSEVADSTILQSNNSTGAILKSRTCIFSPFKSDCIVGALWRHLEHCQSATMSSTQPRNLDLSLGISSRLAIHKFEVTLGDYVCTMKMVMKQFVERNRLAHVWNVIADWSSAEARRNVETYEAGYGFIQPMSDDKGSVCLNYSIVNVTAHSLPTGETCGEIRSLIKMYHGLIIGRLQALENQTLDRVIQDKNTLATYS